MEQYPIFFKLGALASHIQSISPTKKDFFISSKENKKKSSQSFSGFRQKEIRFFGELFSNWIQVGGIGAVYNIHNTQILRFITSLLKNGYARAVHQKKPQHYLLTRIGLYEIVNNLVNRSYLSDRFQCILVWYILKSYTPHIQDVIRKAGSGFSKAHVIEMEQLLDRKVFLERQIRYASLEVARLEERIKSAKDIVKEVSNLQNTGNGLQKWIEVVAKNHPYELNPQKPFRTLLSTLPEEIITWELTSGSALRGEIIFPFLLGEIVRFRDCLKSFLNIEHEQNHSSPQ
jgi:hypothetical protein